MTILSAATWPLLQDLQETKHKSGLFSCTATYIRPAGDTSLPTQIETFIGPVEVWPDPSVNKDTSGFDRITATGYGIWDDAPQEVTWGLQKGAITARASVSDASGDVRRSSRNITAFFDAVVVKKIGAAVPPIPTRDPSKPGLRVYDLTSTDVTAKVFNVANFYSGITPAAYTGTPPGLGTTAVFDKTMDISTKISGLRQISFGTVVETEVIYEIASAVIDFGHFYPI